MNTLDLYLEFASAGRQGGKFLLQHPVLMSPPALAELLEWVKTLTGDEAANWARLLRPLMSTAERVNTEGYPLSEGPIEEIWGRRQAGEIDEAQALELARQAAPLMSLAYALALTRYSARLDRTRWPEAVGVQRLLVAAVEGALGPEAEAMRFEVGEDFLQVARTALVEVADGRLFREAKALGETLVERARRANEPERVAKMLFVLGVLYFDPYQVNRDARMYEAEIHRWKERARDKLGPEFRKLPATERDLPEPREAFAEAEHCLREAMRMAGADRDTYARSLKALIGVLRWQQVVFKQDHREAILALGREALGVLDARDYPQQRAAAISAILGDGGTVEDNVFDGLLERSPDDYVRQRPEIAVDVAKELLLCLGIQAPARALEYARAVRPLFARHGSEADRVFLWSRELNLLAKVHTAPGFERRAGSATRDEAERAVAQANAGQWDPRTLACELLNLAMHSSEGDQEATGLELIDEIGRRAPLFAADYATALAFLRATLQQNLGVNGFKAHDLPAASANYGKALGGFIDLDLLERIVDFLGRMEETARAATPEAARAILDAIAPRAAHLQTALGESASRLIRGLCKRTLASVSRQNVDADVILSLMQVAKGLRFASSLYTGVASGWKDDEEDRGQLVRVAEAEAEAAAETGASAQARVDKEVALTSYVSDEPRGGATAAERLANLRMKYDQNLNRRLLAGTEGGQAPMLRINEVRQALDERTVLACIYLGVAPTDQVAVYILLITREGVRAVAPTYPSLDGSVELTSAGRTFYGHVLAPRVQEVRTAVLADPPGRARATPAALKALEEDYEFLFGGVEGDLDELRKAGKRRLCIVPHGPLHCYPFHLLGRLGRPLAADWIVSSLPSLHLFLARRGRAAARRYRGRGLAALGLSFADVNPFGLPKIKESLSETREVARVFGEKPLLDAAATPRALFDALDGSRFVHLSTHGALDPDAPAFQLLHLHPDEHSDGRVFAHEILSRDLRGLELLTLSACETALGRFDADDNLRGLPASFFQAGASAIVGTLWDTEVTSARTFFVTLYGELKQGAARLDAFAAAQRETRKRHPQYRDWGAFHYMGD
jgi:hypothetical protein